MQRTYACVALNIEWIDLCRFLKGVCDRVDGTCPFSHKIAKEKVRHTHTPIMYVMYIVYRY